MYAGCKQPAYVWQAPMKLAILLVISCSTCITEAGTLITGGKVSEQQCELLNQEVSLQLSNGVSGAWSCDQKTKNIKVAVCSHNGSTTPTTITCSPIGHRSDGSKLYNSENCNSQKEHYTLKGPRLFVASSAFPAPATVELGLSCNNITIKSAQFLD